MSWVGKFGKPEHASVMDITENDFPISEVSFMRIGAAHVKERGGDRDVLMALLEKFIQEVNVPFDEEPSRHALEVLELKEGK